MPRLLSQSHVFGGFLFVEMMGTSSSQHSSGWDCLFGVLGGFFQSVTRISWQLLVILVTWPAHYLESRHDPCFKTRFRVVWSSKPEVTQCRSATPVGHPPLGPTGSVRLM